MPRFLYLVRLTREQHAFISAMKKKYKGKLPFVASSQTYTMRTDKFQYGILEQRAKLYNSSIGYEAYRAVVDFDSKQKDS